MTGISKRSSSYKTTSTFCYFLILFIIIQVHSSSCWSIFLPLCLLQKLNKRAHLKNIHRIYKNPTLGWCKRTQGILHLPRAPFAFWHTTSLYLKEFSFDKSETNAHHKSNQCEKKSYFSWTVIISGVKSKVPEPLSACQYQGCVT